MGGQLMPNRKDFTYDRNGNRDYAYRRPERGPRVHPGTGRPHPGMPYREEVEEEPPMDDDDKQAPWTALLPMLIDSLERGTPAMRTLAKDELARMAELADQYAGLCR